MSGRETNARRGRARAAGVRRGAAALLVAAGLSGAGVAPRAEQLGEDFFRERCSGCHDVSELGRLAVEDWIARLDELGEGPPPGAQGDVVAYLRAHSRRAETMLSMAEEKRLFERKCGECHPSARIFLVTLSPDQRRHVLRRMREHWEGGASWITAEEAERILAFVEQAVAAGREPSAPAVEGGAKEIFRQRCAGCHSLDRVYQQVKNERGKASAWVHVVNRMRDKAPEWISEEEARRIVEYLQSRTYPKPAK